MDKPTVVIGASPNPERYSYKAVRMLQNYGHTVHGLGIHEGIINGLTISMDQPVLDNVDTVTLYVSPKNQYPWIDYILSLNPKRIIFNPGTENDEFIKEARSRGIECLEACTLVMLSIGVY
ncbi:MAG: CoA-binding protein [Bacteroidia bacterium]